MITPAYSLTATERVLPRLTLNFMSGVLDSRIAVTRALNTATRINSSGYIEAVNADLPRFDYDPVTLALKGLLIEEARANLAVQSNAFTTSPWLSSAGISIASAAATSPDGTVNGWLWTRSSTAASFTTQTITKAASAITYTTTYYVKQSVGNFCALRLQGLFPALADAVFNLSTVTITEIRAINGFTNGSATIQAVGNGWFRVSLTATSDAHTELQTVVSFNSNGVRVNGTDSVSNSAGYLYGAQLETGAFATSYIPTTTTSLTRNADVVAMTGTNFSSWWQATIGGMLVRARQSVITGVRPWVNISDGTANNIISLRGNAADPELYIKATTDQAQIDAGTLAANTSYNLVGAWNTNSCAASLNGGAAATDNSATIPTVDRMLIGSDGTNYLNGWEEKISFWPQRITNAETQAFSK